MSQLDKWMVGGKISKLVIVITDKDTGEHVERWQFDVCMPHMQSIFASKISHLTIIHRFKSLGRLLQNQGHPLKLPIKKIRPQGAPMPSTLPLKPHPPLLRDLC